MDQSRSGSLHSARLTGEEEEAVKQFMLQANQWRLSHGDQLGTISRSTAIKFLMARKFSCERAFELYEQHQIIRHEEGLNNMKPSEEPVKSQLNSEKFTVLSTRDVNGAAVAVFTARLHDPHDRAATMKAVLFQLDVALSDPDTQRQGLVFLYDMTGVRWSNRDLKLANDLIDILKGGFPARLKKILVLNAPFWLQVPYRLLKSFLTPKMLDRLYVISTLQLFEHIPSQSLPVTLGGTYTHEHQKWLRTCLMHVQEDPSCPIPPAKANPLRRKDSTNYADGRRDGQIFQTTAADELEQSKDMLGVHRQSDKGMGMTEFVRMIHSMGKEGILREYEGFRAATKLLNDTHFTTCRLPENRAKNRYVDVPCLEESRVRLNDCSPKDDYIHANFVDGYEQKNAFISTQGPMPKTYRDFWLMVWEQGCHVLVMTTRTVERGKQKCGQYWPVIAGETMENGDFIVVNDSMQVYAQYIETRLTLSWNKNESRNVVHLQFTDWPDYGVPHSAQSMFDFIAVMRKCQKAAVMSLGSSWIGHPAGPPIIVHCSAGIGRSGSLCALDICIRRLDDCGLVDVHQTVQKLRSQRCQSIQMPEQYLFCYLALVEYAVLKGLISKQDENMGLEQMLTWLQDDL